MREAFRDESGGLLNLPKYTLGTGCLHAFIVLQINSPDSRPDENLLNFGTADRKEGVSQSSNLSYNNNKFLLDLIA